MLVRIAVAAFALASTAAAQRADTTVRIAGAPVHPRVATLREELSIGVADGKAEYMFGEVADIAVGRDGTILVVDRKGLVIRRYDSRGNYLGPVGRRGEGPGEHRAPPGVGFARDGGILVWDTGTWRINVFSPAGEYRTLWPVPRSGAQGSSSARGLVVDSAGNAHVRLAKIDFDTRKVERYWVKLRPDGTAADSLFEPEVAGRVTGLRAEAPGGQSNSAADVPFSPQPQVALSPLGYFVTGFPDRLAVELHRPGQAILSIRRPDAKPLPVSAHERDSARARITEMMKRVDPTWTWGSTDIPRTKPYFTRIFMGDDGRIWLPLVKETLPNIGSLFGSAGSGGGPNRAPPTRRPDALPISDAKVEALYDVYEPSGTYVGQVRIPPRHVVGVTRGDYLWAIAFDDDDVASVKRYRIVW